MSLFPCSVVDFARDHTVAPNYHAASTHSTPNLLIILFSLNILVSTYQKNITHVILRDLLSSFYKTYIAYHSL